MGCSIHQLTLIKININLQQFYIGIQNELKFEDQETRVLWGFVYELEYLPV